MAGAGETSTPAATQTSSPTDVSASVFRDAPSSVTADIAERGRLSLKGSCVTFVRDNGEVFNLGFSEILSPMVEGTVVRVDLSGLPVEVSDGDLVGLGGGVTVMPTSEVDWVSPPAGDCGDQSVLIRSIGALPDE